MRSAIGSHNPNCRKIPPQGSNLVVHCAVADSALVGAHRKSLAPVLRNVIRVYVANETFTKLFFKVRHALLISFLALRRETSFVRQPHVRRVREQRYPLALRDAVVGLFQLATPRSFRILRNGLAVALRGLAEKLPVGQY